MGSKGSNQVSTQQTYTPDPQIKAAGYQALGGAQSAANQPFQMPQAPVAGFSPFQQQAFGQVQASQGMSLPYFDDAAQFMRGSASPISQQDVQQYYNPMAQNVTNQLQNIFGQQMHQATGNATQAAGGVGADRIGVAQGNIANQQGLAAGQTYAGLYQQALQAAQQNKQMQAGAGFGMGQLGPAAQNSFLQGTTALGQAGGQQQALQQQQLNSQYQQQLAAIAYPFQTPQYLAGITGGLAPAMGGTTNATTTYPSPSPLAQGLGVGASALGMFGGLGGFGGMGGKGGGSSYGPTYGAPSGGWGSMGGVSYPTFRRGGRAFADGGTTYGDLASTQGAKVGNPYGSDDDETPDSGYADGGDVDDTPSLPGAAPPPINSTSIVPKISMPSGGGHSGLLGHEEIKHIPLPQGGSGGGAGGGSGGSSDAIKAGAQVAMQVLPFMLARGGPVNPFDINQRFADGGETDDYLGGSAEPQPDFPFESGKAAPDNIDTMDVPYETAGARPKDPHFSLSGLAERASEFYPEKARQIGESTRQAIAGLNANPSTPNPVGGILPQSAQIFGGNQAQSAPASPSQPASTPDVAPTPAAMPVNPMGFPNGQVPLPRGNPRTTDGVRATMANEWSSAGMSPVGLQGVEMNVADESKFDPNSRIPDQPKWGGEAHYAHGLYQEGGAEWNNYQAWLQKNAPGADWRDPALQSRFTAQNLRENYPQVWKAMNEAKTPGEAADAFLRGYLKPAAEHVASRSEKYLGGEQNPYGNKNIVANRDMTMASVLGGKKPYPDALDRDWGQNLTRSPWMSLVKAGAAMAGATGPIGSVIGKGIGAGANELDRQRGELRNEQELNNKADALFQHAKTHLDAYQRMTPYEKATSDWRQSKLESPTGAAGWKYRAWLSANPGDEKGALEFAGGRRQVPEPQLRRWAADQAIKEKRDDPSIDINKRTNELLQYYKEGQTSAEKPKPAPSDIDYVKKHPEAAAKFREQFGIDPPTT